MAPSSAASAFSPNVTPAAARPLMGVYTRPPAVGFQDVAFFFAAAKRNRPPVRINRVKAYPPESTCRC